MDKTPSIPVKISRLLKANQVMTLRQLSDELKGRARSSLFRDIQSLSIISSFTHAGKYHALSATPVFDATGLWFYQKIGFSKYGTLKATLVHWIETTPVGKTHQELQEALQVPVHNTLKALVASQKITRQLMPNRLYVYLHGDQTRAQRQYARRVAMKSSSLSKIRLPARWLVIEILAEIIRSCNVTVESRHLSQQLALRGIEVSADEISCVLTFHDIKKKPI